MHITEHANKNKKKKDLDEVVNISRSVFAMLKLHQY